MKKQWVVLVTAGLASTGLAGCAPEGATQAVGTGGGATSTTAAASVPLASSTTRPPPTTVTSGSGVTTNPDGTPKVGMWKAQTSSGPLADALMRGGKVQCTANATGKVWELQPLDPSSGYGAVQLTFGAPGELDEVPVKITRAGDKDTLAEGTAKVTITDDGAGVVTFSFKLSYTATSTSSGQTGDLQVIGACAQQPAPA